MSSPALKTTSPSAITQKLLADHQEMSGLINALKPSLREICRHQASDELKKARETIQQLVHVMNTHADCEDKAIFPALSRHHQLLALEGEHDELLMKRAALHSGILNYTFPEDCSGKLYNQAMEFLDLFERHMAKEERIVFPLIEESLSPEEKFMVLRRMEELQAKTQTSPYPQGNQPSNGFIRFYFPVAEPVTQNGHACSILEKDGLQIKTLGMKAGDSLSSHYLSQQAILLLYSGKAKWFSPSVGISLREGEGILIDPNLPYSIEAEADCRFLLILNKHIDWCRSTGFSGC